ncbi:uncharacterized protein PV09_08005 [Verruconis gallopava]|uniref:Major facilitator superfamily (MFS) profile domain-containing protein n=1 Tax=Verruconis gallopava TaxID=253628 RepID=A0A0D1YI15_9PEZI|nr:uncharacterized protein PV09_08005 [Verruconis gallopava]KIW00482.1 hypothetical protein PV09_08005 [Verruconis gallopava]
MDNKLEASETIENVPKNPYLSGTDTEDDEVAAEAIGGTTKDLPPGYYRSPSFIGTIVALCLGNCSCYLGWVLPANTLLLINEDIGPDPNITWVALVWTLTISVSFVLTGRFSDLLGRRWFFIIGNAIGLVGTILGATAHNVNQLIVGNALTGIAAAVQLSFTVVISELLPAKWRGYGIGALFFSSMPFAAFGPVIARSFITHTSAGWRWSYYLNIIVAGLTVLLFFLFYHPPTYGMLHTRHSKSDIFKMLDIGGAVLFLGGLVLFLIGISWGGVIYPWKSAKVIGMIIGGFGILVVFVLYEVYIVKEHQLIPMRLFKNRGYVGTILTAAIGSCVYYSMNVLWPAQIGVLYETSVMNVGWWSCVIGAGAVIGQTLCGALVRVLRKQKWQLVFTTLCLVAFTGGMAAATTKTRSMALAFVLLASIALGYLENTAFTIASFCLPPGDLGLALGLLGCVRSSIATVASAVFQTVLSNKLTTNLPKYVTPAATNAGLPPSSLPELFKALTTGNFTSVPGITPEITAAAAAANQTAYTESFKVVYLVSLAFGGLGIIASLNAPNVEKFFTENIPRRLHGRDIEKKTFANEKVEQV